MVGNALANDNQLLLLKKSQSKSFFTMRYNFISFAVALAAAVAGVTDAAATAATPKANEYKSGDW